MFDSLLLPVDETPESERVIPIAAAVAGLVDASIEFLTIDAPHTDVGQMASYHEQLVHALPPGVRGRGTVELGDAPVVELLLDAYRSRPTSLLALATRAPGSLWQWLGGGSVGDEVVEETLRPVLLAGPRCDVARTIETLGRSTTAALDGSVLDDQVYAAAVDWSRRMGSALTLTRVVVTPAEPRAHADAEADVELRGHEARRFVEDVRVHVVDAGDPARVLLHQVANAGGVLVLGSHRRGPLGRMIHGSNALWTTHRSPVPVLVAGFRAAVATGAATAPAPLPGVSMAPCTPRTIADLVGWVAPEPGAG